MAGTGILPAPSTATCSTPPAPGADWLMAVFDQIDTREGRGTVHPRVPPPLRSGSASDDQRYTTRWDELRVER